MDGHVFKFVASILIVCKNFQSRQNNREEIRRKLAMGIDEEYYFGERMGRKPNLQTRLQSGMNLQICFMNEVLADSDANLVQTHNPDSNIQVITRIHACGHCNVIGHESCKD